MKDYNSILTIPRSAPRTTLDFLYRSRSSSNGLKKKGEEMKDRFTLLNIMLIVFLSGVHAAPAQTKSPTHKEVRAVWTHFDQVVEPDSEQGKQSILFAGEGYSHGGGTGISTSRARILYDGLSDPSR